MTNIERDIGRLEAVAASLENQNEELKKELAALKTELAEIKQLIAQIKGGSRVLFWMGGLASGGIGAAIVKYLPIIFAR